MKAVAHRINSQRRLHLQHGPIDLIVQAWGEKDVIETAYLQATERFDSVLTELVAELPQLRTRTDQSHCQFTGAIARRMWRSASCIGQTEFTTPMIAVAGSVADEILSAMTEGLTLQKACVNNGGDIAIALSPGYSTSVGIVTDLHHKVRHRNMPATLEINYADGIGGLATSGWRGRSLSTGIADAVTVLANDAASADTAATLIANAVDIKDCRSIVRMPASEVDPDSDLADQLVTTDVLPLTDAQVKSALEAGRLFAEQLVRRKLIISAGLSLAGEYQTSRDQKIRVSKPISHPTDIAYHSASNDAKPTEKHHYA